MPNVESDSRWIIATTPARRIPVRRNRPLVHLGLLLLTVATTLIAGALFEASGESLGWQEILGILKHPGSWIAGAPYSLSVLAILLSHELGHYLACRHYRIDASLPYFIPGIPILGTFGAFIRIRERITDRKALFDPSL